MSNKAKQNGVAQLDEQTEAMRMQVVQLELRARYWKANFEIKHYMLADRDLKEPYEEYMKFIIEEERKKLDELKSQMATNEEKGITIEPVLEGEQANETEEQAPSEV